MAAAALALRPPDPAEHAPTDRRSVRPAARLSSPLALAFACGCGGTLQRACCASCERGEACEDERADGPRGLTLVPADHPLEREAERAAATAVAGRSTGDRVAPASLPAPAASLALGAGHPLAERERAFFEARLGHDFAPVRIHTGAAAAEATRSVGARAFTVGRHVVFGAGEYAPATNPGRSLLAHELVHTVQQGSADKLMRQELEPGEIASAATSAQTASTATGVGESPPRQTEPSQSASTEMPAGEDLAVSIAAETVSGIGTLTSAAATAATGALGSSTAPPCRREPPLFVPGPPLVFDFDSTTLLPGHGPLLASLIADAMCASSIELHGNASSEGSLPHNVDLACRRAAAIDLLMSGVPVPRRLLTHGPTTAFGTAPPSPTSPDANRNVVVVMTFPTSPPPLPSRAVTPASATPALIGVFAPVGGCGAGDDSLSADFPTLTGGTFSRSVILANGARLLPNAALEATLDTELVTAAGAGPAGTAALTRFNAGTGGTAVHGPGSSLATLMVADSHFLSAFHTAEADVQTQARAQAAAGALDFRRFRVIPASISFPPSATGFGSGPLASVLGGTQGTQIFVINFAVIPCTRTYTATLRFVVCDDFGVDEGDIKSPGLAAFWVLQHERPPGHRAFINEVRVDLSTSGSF